MIAISSKSIFKSPEYEKQYMDAYEAVLALWHAPSEPLDVTTSFGTTHVNACGSKDKPAMILIPGFGANSTMWFSNVAALAANTVSMPWIRPANQARVYPGGNFLLQTALIG
jgi:hypothetical protein